MYLGAIATIDLDLLPDKPEPKPNKWRRKRKKKVDELENHKIVRRTNMITYQKRLHAHRKRKTQDNMDTPPEQRFKRRQHTSSPNAHISTSSQTRDQNPNQLIDTLHKFQRNPE